VAGSWVGDLGCQHLPSFVRAFQTHNGLPTNSSAVKTFDSGDGGAALDPPYDVCPLHPAGTQCVTATTKLNGQCLI
jgi:hypothetical protein